MKTKLAAILAITMILLWPLQIRSQQSEQPIKHFGYIGATTDSDLNRVRSYTDFTFVAGEYGQSIVDLSTRVKNNGMRVVIDLGRVLWCQQDLNIDLWHLCYYNADVNYGNRWNNWISMNGPVLNSNYVLAFSVITEPTQRGISTADVERAVALVKQTYPQIPTLVTDSSESITNPIFEVPSNADWIGIFKYYTHPNLDDGFKESVRVLKLKKYPWQRTAYALDGFYGPSHRAVALSVADMDTIAQEWYTIASEDPEAILLAPFLWADLPSEEAIGSKSFPQNVLDKHAAIGAAILAGRFPKYQGSFERIDCQSVVGWAWDASQPNTPVSVDIYAYDRAQTIATVRANQFRQDLLNAGIGNGQHGFSLSLPASLRDGRSHWIQIHYSGLGREFDVGRPITCPASP